MKRPGIVHTCWLLAALAACTSGPGTESPVVSTGGDGDGDARDQDASVEEHETPGIEDPDGAHAGGDAGENADTDASDDAGEPGPRAPTGNGVHLSVAGEPYQSATDIFYFESGGHPGIQGNFPGATLRVELSATPGALRCSDGGAAIAYEVDDGELRANTELGSCTVELEAIGTMPGDPITATVHAIIERVTGEVADSLRLEARIQVAHP